MLEFFACVRLFLLCCGEYTSYCNSVGNNYKSEAKNEHIDEILGEIQHRMMEIWSVIPTGLYISYSSTRTEALLKSSSEIILWCQNMLKESVDMEN